MTEGYEELWLPAAGSGNIGDPHESQTEASEVEGGCTTFNNIGSTNGVAIRATELICKMNTGQPATGGAARRAEEEEFEENLREKRRIERKEEREVHALLQENKQERDLEKAIQAEDDRIRSEEEEDISNELDELTDEPKEGEKVKSYWNWKKKEGNTPSGALSKTAQKRVDVLQKIHGPVPVGLAGSTLQGPSREGCNDSR